MIGIIWPSLFEVRQQAVDRRNQAYASAQGKEMLCDGAVAFRGAEVMVGASVGPALNVDGSNNFPSRILLAAVSKDIPCSLPQLSH